MAKPKILLFDIEATGLNAAFGTILCIGSKWHGEKQVAVPTILDANKDMLSDKKLVADFAKRWNEADYVVSWYGKRYDEPMIQTKLLRHKLAPLSPKPHLDLWFTARYQFKLHNNRLAAWEQFLGTEHSKTPIDFESWLQAAHGNKAAIAEVVEHCRKDVLVLEEIFDKFRPWIKGQPASQLFGADSDVCPSCGSKHVQKRGYKVAATRIYQQYQCNDCGKWFRDAKALKTVPLRN